MIPKIQQTAEEIETGLKSLASGMSTFMTNNNHILHNTNDDVMTQATLQIGPMTITVHNVRWWNRVIWKLSGFIYKPSVKYNGGSNGMAQWTTGPSNLTTLGYVQTNYPTGISGGSGIITGLGTNGTAGVTGRSGLTGSIGPSGVAGYSTYTTTGEFEGVPEISTTVAPTRITSPGVFMREQNENWSAEVTRANQNDTDYSDFLDDSNEGVDEMDMDVMREILESEEEK